MIRAPDSASAGAAFVSEQSNRTDSRKPRLVADFTGHLECEMTPTMMMMSAWRRHKKSRPAPPRFGDRGHNAAVPSSSDPPPRRRRISKRELLRLRNDPQIRPGRLP